MIRLKVSPDRSESLLNRISHGRFKTGRAKNWKVNQDGYICEQSVLWLFCWAYNGDNSEEVAEAIRKIFDEIFTFSYKYFNENVGYKYAEKKRYSKKNLEKELKEKLNEDFEDKIYEVNKEFKDLEDKEEKKKLDFGNNLKRIDVKAMEKAIGSVLTKLASNDFTYICEIKNINYSGRWGASLTLKLNRKLLHD